MTYKEFLMEKYLEEDTPNGDFARDVMRDNDFPNTNSKSKIQKHLLSVRSCDEALECFKDTFTEYCDYESEGESNGRTNNLYKVRQKYR